MSVRLQKILSSAGISSRRAAETLIQEGRVTVNGTTVTELGSKADPEADDIRVDGRRVRIPSRRRYILLYKPRGYITTRSDPERRPTVIDLLTKGGVREYVYPVGRLDYDSEGLLILTNDGDLAAKLTHPRHGIAREYQVRVRGVPDRHALERLARGITLDGQKTAPVHVELDSVLDAADGPQGILAFVIREGRNRQVRRMCDAVGHPVVRLSRVRIGPISDERIRPGEFRDLSPREVTALKSAIANPSRLRQREGGQAIADRPAFAKAPAGRQSVNRESAAGNRHSVSVRRADAPRTRRGPRSHAPRRSDRPRRG